VALALGRHYGPQLGRLAEDSRWARRLVGLGREADVACCLRADTTGVVPVFAAGGFEPRRSAGAGA